MLHMCDPCILCVCNSNWCWLLNICWFSVKFNCTMQIYAEMIGNVMVDARSTGKYYHCKCSAPKTCSNNISVLMLYVFLFSDFGDLGCSWIGSQTIIYFVNSPNRMISNSQKNISHLRKIRFFLLSLRRMGKKNPIWMHPSVFKSLPIFYYSYISLWNFVVLWYSQ